MKFNNYFLNLLLLLLSILFIKINNGQLTNLTPMVNKLSLTISNPNFISHVRTPTDSICTLYYRFLIFNNDSSIGTTVTGFKSTTGVDEQPSILMKSSDNSIYYSTFQFTVPLYSSLILNLTITSSTSTNSIYQVNQTCIDVLNENKLYEIDSIPNVSNGLYTSLFLMDEKDAGIFSVLENTESLRRLFVKNTYLLIWPYAINGEFIDRNWTMVFTFYKNKTVTFTSKSYYYNSYQYINEISYLPPNINNSNSIFTQFGSSYNPLVKMNIDTNVKKPYFFVCIYPQCSNIYTMCKAIGGTKGNMTYLTSFYYLNSDPTNYTISYANNKNLIINKVVETQFNGFKIPLLNNNGSPLVKVNLLDSPISIFSSNFNSTTLYQNTKLSYTLYGRSLNKGWPFGFSSGNNLNYTHLVSFPKSNYYSVFGNDLYISTYSQSDGSSSPIPTISPNLVGTPPQVLSYKFIRVIGQIIIFSMDIISTNGVQYFNIDAINYGIETLISGNIYNGTYEIILGSAPQMVQIVDIFNTILSFNTYDGYISLNPLLKFQNSIGLKDINYSDIINITFSTNDLDLIDKDNYIIAYLNSSNLPHDYPLSFIQYDLYTSQNINYINDLNMFIYNSTLDLFTCKFIVKKNGLFGNIGFFFTFYDFGALFLNIDYPDSNQLRVNNTKFDNEGPVFKSVKKIGDGATVVNGLAFGWNLTITDEYNGFESGYIKVMGSLDSSTYHFNFTLNDFITGNKYEGVYQLLINISNPCVSQQYSIVYVELVDTNQIINSFELYNIFNVDSTTNPFIYLYENSLDGGISITTISSVCTPSFIDNSQPTLLSFTSSSSTLDVGLVDRSVSFNFEIIPSQTGVKVGCQSPIIYIVTKNMDSLECLSKLIYINSTYAQYTCTTELPLGFGYPGQLLLSVYGVVNNGGQYHGFSTQNLLSTSSLGYINTTMTLNQPILNFVYRYYSDDTEIIIFGKSLSMIDQIFFKDTETGNVLQGFKPDSLTFYGSSAIKISNITPIEKSFNIIATFANVESNNLLINPVYFKLTPPNIPSTPSPSPTSSPSPTPTPTSTPIPTNPPQKCFGNPVCGGEKKGFCTENGCVCKSNWIGPNCDSQIIIIPTPTINNTSPSVIIPSIPTDDSNSNNDNDLHEIFYKSFISLVSLREIDYIGQQVVNYAFEKWIYTPITELKNQYNTSILDNTVNITATLEWFYSSTIIEFANQTLSMNPSTMKYTIDITGDYKFSNQLNQLELIILASFESSKTNDICSDTQFGNTTSGDDSNYLKIQIDNHSLYGRFIKRAIVDGVFRGISNQLLDSSMNAITTASSVSTYVAITIPQFKNQIIIDPDFSVLIDSQSASSSSNSICNVPSSGLTTTQLVGIIIGSVGFLLVIIISITYAIIRTRKQKKFISSVNNKLNNVK